MLSKELTIPVAFIIFNRADLTERVFDAIRQARPAKLYIIADGPRKEEEKKTTEAARAVTQEIDWPCQSIRLYSDINLGCKKRVITGLNEVFAREEKAIILEDDCLPHPDFFNYCQTLLTKYENDERVGTINGTSLPGLAATVPNNSCVFTRFSIVWGWATTKRVWQLVDPEVKEWEHLKKTGWIKQFFPGEGQITYGIGLMFDLMRTGYDAWSYALLFALLKNNLLNIHPAQNLISNIGFDARAAHTHAPKPYSNMPFGSGWKLPLYLEIQHDPRADKLIFETLYYWHLRKKPYFRVLQRRIWLAIYGLKQKFFPGIRLKKLLKMG